MASQELIDKVNSYKHLLTTEYRSDVMKAIIMAINVALQAEKDEKYGLDLAEWTKDYIEKFIIQRTGRDIWFLEQYYFSIHQSNEILEQYYDVLKEEAWFKLESFIYYMERKREPSKRFYKPREKTLNVVLSDLEDLANRKIKFYGLSMPSRVGKSTICIFFLSWIALKRPNSHSAMGGHSGILAKGFYKELMNLFTTEEYCFEELFSHFHAGHTCIRDKSAEDFTITLDEPDRFATITCRGIDGTWTGAVDVSYDGILYVDDLVRDREHSLSATRMETTYQEYLNKMVDRKSGFDPQDGSFAGACELMVGTLWNVLDPLERIRKANENNPLYRFRRIPALNEDDESNFNYEINGFSTEYYKDMRERLDNAEWMAKYQQKPYVREGLLFPTEELRYFNGILPDGDHRTVGVVDVAWGGGDSLSMPIGAEYENGDVYIYDWVFNQGAKEITLPLVVGQIINNGLRAVRFEGNQGGDLYQQYVDERLIENGWKCSTSSKKAPNRIAKKEKIIAYSGDVKRRFIFLQSQKPTQEQLQKDAELGIKRYVRSKEYQNAMDEFCSYVTIGENEHDDAPDGITQLEMFLEGGNSLAKIEIPKNPMRGGGYY